MPVKPITAIPPVLLTELRQTFEGAGQTTTRPGKPCTRNASSISVKCGEPLVMSPSSSSSVTHWVSMIERIWVWL